MNIMAKLSILFFYFLILTTTYIFAQDNLSIPPTFESKVLKPNKIIDKGNGRYLIDFGKDAFGTLSFLLKSNQRDSIVVHVGEKLNNQNTIDRKPGGSITYQQFTFKEIAANQKLDVIFKPNKRNENPPAILLPDTFGRVLPFRYVEIENLKAPIADLQINQKVFNYKFNDEASSFNSSDTVLNQLWDMFKHTIKATSFTGLYIDGDRERIPYEGDAYINQLSHYVVDNEYTLARRTNEYFMETPTWPTEWLLHTVLLFYNDYMYTGDKAVLEKHYDKLKDKTLYFLKREDGLLDTHKDRITPEMMKSVGFKNETTKMADLVDWPINERDGHEMLRVNTVVNAFYYRNLQLMAEIAKVLNKSEDATNFRKEALKVKHVFNQKLFDANKGIYIDGELSKHSSIHSNLFALAFGLVSDVHKKSVIDYIKSRGMACSVYAAQFLLEGLYDNGEAEYAYKLIVNQEGDRNWWNMIKQGSTMAWEAWDIKYKPNQDWNHAWGTAPLNVIGRNMWGITPAKPGFTKARIHPQLGSLTSTELNLPTIKGTIIATYKKNGNTHNYSITLPKEMDADFVLPKVSYLKIKVNGKIVNHEDYVVTLKQGKKYNIEIVM